MMTLDESMSEVKRAGDSETVSEFVSLSADLVLSIDPSINQPVSQCIESCAQVTINRSTNGQSICLLIIQWTGQSSINQCIMQPASHHNQSASQSVRQSATQQVKRSVSQSVTIIIQSVSQSVIDTPSCSITG